MRQHETQSVENFDAAIREKSETILRAMMDDGALFVVNHSAGKDSQAMLIALRRFGVPDAQLLIVHADLGEVEWRGNLDHIRATCGGLPIITAKARKTFFDMVEHRQRFPSPQYRQCTSDLKRGPIEREIRRYLKAHPEFGGKVVSCMGIRAAESATRASKAPLRRRASQSKAGRDWWEWLPIFDLSEAEVFAMIADAGQSPHWAYEAGMTRLSCCFCIMGSTADLTTAARLNPKLYRKYVETERRLGFTLSPSQRTLPQITGIAA